jgi:hypothetical protein
MRFHDSVVSVHVLDDRICLGLVAFSGKLILSFCQIPNNDHKSSVKPVEVRVPPFGTIGITNGIRIGIGASFFISVFPISLGGGGSPLGVSR